MSSAIAQSPTSISAPRTDICRVCNATSCSEAKAFGMCLLKAQTQIGVERRNRVREEGGRHV